jgi:hypothetical protein
MSVFDQSGQGKRLVNISTRDGRLLAARPTAPATDSTDAALLHPKIGRGFLASIALNLVLDSLSLVE